MTPAHHHTPDFDAYEVTPEWVTESAQAETESQLIPKGKWDGQITSYTSRTVDLPKSPYVGHPMARVSVDLFNVNGKKRMHFFNVSPFRVMQEDGRDREESYLMATLSKLTGETKPTRILEAAKDLRLTFEITVSPAKGDYPARNWTRRITLAG